MRIWREREANSGVRHCYRLPAVTASPAVWRYRGLVGQLAQREIKLKYKRSVLGWLWSLINPAATLGIYILVFGFFLKIQPPVAGNGHLKSFGLWLFSGLVMWNFFAAVST